MRDERRNPSEAAIWRFAYFFFSSSSFFRSPFFSFFPFFLFFPATRDGKDGTTCPASVRFPSFFLRDLSSFLFPSLEWFALGTVAWSAVFLWQTDFYTLRRLPGAVLALPIPLFLSSFLSHRTVLLFLFFFSLFGCFHIMGVVQFGAKAAFAATVSPPPPPFFSFLSPASWPTRLYADRRNGNLRGSRFFLPLFLSCSGKLFFPSLPSCHALRAQAESKCGCRPWNERGSPFPLFPPFFVVIPSSFFPPLCVSPGCLVSKS